MRLGAGKTCIYIDTARIAKGSNSEDEELELDSDLKRWMRDVAGEVKDFRNHIFCMNQYMGRVGRPSRKGQSLRQDLI